MKQNKFAQFSVHFSQSENLTLPNWLINTMFIIIFQKYRSRTKKVNRPTTKNYTIAINPQSGALSTPRIRSQNTRISHRKRRYFFSKTHLIIPENYNYHLINQFCRCVIGVIAQIGFISKVRGIARPARPTVALLLNVHCHRSRILTVSTTSQQLKTNLHMCVCVDVVCSLVHSISLV